MLYVCYRHVNQMPNTMSMWIDLWTLLNQKTQRNYHLTTSWRWPYSGSNSVTRDICFNRHILIVPSPGKWFEQMKILIFKTTCRVLILKADISWVGSIWLLSWTIDIRCQYSLLACKSNHLGLIITYVQWEWLMEKFMCILPCICFYKYTE